MAKRDRNRTRHFDSAKAARDVLRILGRIEAIESSTEEIRAIPFGKLSCREQMRLVRDLIRRKDVSIAMLADLLPDAQQPEVYDVLVEAIRKQCASLDYHALLKLKDDDRLKPEAQVVILPVIAQHRDCALDELLESWWHLDIMYQRIQGLEEAGQQVGEILRERLHGQTTQELLDILIDHPACYPALGHLTDRADQLRQLIAGIAQSKEAKRTRGKRNSAEAEKAAQVVACARWVLVILGEMTPHECGRQELLQMRLHEARSAVKESIVSTIARNSAFSLQDLVIMWEHGGDEAANFKEELSGRCEKSSTSDIARAIAAAHPQLLPSLLSVFLGRTDATLADFLVVKPAIDRAVSTNTERLYGIIIPVMETEDALEECLQATATTDLLHLAERQDRVGEFVLVVLANRVHELRQLAK